MTIITASAALTGVVSASTTYLAGPLDQVNAWVTQWGTSLQLLGGTVLAICMVLVGIKLGAKSVASSGANTGHLNPPGESGDSTLIETMLLHRYSSRYRRFAPISRAAYLRSIHTGAGC